MRKPVALKGVAQQILALAVDVALLGRVDGHDILHEVQIAERHAGLETVDGNAAVSTQDIVHMQLPNTLLGFRLEGFRGGGKVGVLVSEQLIGDLTGEQNPNVGGLVDGLADQVHPHTGTDGSDVIGAQQLHHVLQSGQDVLLGDDDLGVVAADVVGHLLGVFQVDGVLAHADGEGADGFLALTGCDGADQRGIQAAGEQEAHLGIGDQALFNAFDQLFMDFGADRLHIVHAHLVYCGDVVVADEFPVLIVVSGREGHDLAHQPHQVLGFAGKDDDAMGVVAIVQGTNADGVTGGDVALGVSIVEDQGKLRIQTAEHICAVLLIHGQQNLTVGLADEGVFARLHQLLFQAGEAINFAVADHIAAVQLEGLHPFRMQTHDGQTVETQQPLAGVNDPAVIGTAGDGAVKKSLKFRYSDTAVTEPHNRTHRKILLHKIFSIG